MADHSRRARGAGGGERFRLSADGHPAQVAPGARAGELSEAGSLRWETTLMGHSVFERARVLDAFGGFQNLQTYDVTILIIVENHARLVLVTLFDRRIPEDNAQYIDLRVIRYFHASLQYFSTGASYHPKL